MTMNNARRPLLAWLRVFALLCGALAAGSAAGSDGRPNILFILADDLGYGDLGVYGQTDYPTPQLDRLAQEGLRFTQAYAASPICSAARFALITGRYQYRLRGGLEEPIPGTKGDIGLPSAHPTLPSLFKQAGYRTALFGKWHLGFLPLHGPLKSGYEEFFGNYAGYIDYFNHGLGPDDPDGLYEGEAPVRKAGYYTDLLADRAVDFIGRQGVDKPFFLSLHFTAPHWPWEGPGDEAVSRDMTSLLHTDGGSLVTYGKMVGALDSAVGRVLRTLSERGLADNTIVVFSSDNGGERYSRTWPFSGQKTELLEGGLRIPALVRWPARIKPARTSEQVIITMDWLPTLLAAAGAAPDPAYPSDGDNLLPILLGSAAAAPRTLFWRYKANAQRAVRSGDWKYLQIGGNEFLFDVAVDQRERANLAQRQPQELARLKARWEEWNTQMLPITAEVYSQDVKPKDQADHYHAGPGSAASAKSGSAVPD